MDDMVGSRIQGVRRRNPPNREAFQHEGRGGGCDVDRDRRIEARASLELVADGQGFDEHLAALQDRRLANAAKDRMNTESVLNGPFFLDFVLFT